MKTGIIMNFKVGDHIVIIGVPDYSYSKHGGYRSHDTGVIHNIDRDGDLIVNFDTRDDFGSLRRLYIVNPSEAEHSNIHNSPLWKALS